MSLCIVRPTTLCSMTTLLKQADNKIIHHEPGGDSDSGMDEDSDTSETSNFGEEVDAIADMK